MFDPTTFTEYQKEYLKGFFEGMNQRPEAPLFSAEDGSTPTEEIEPHVYGTPLDDLCKEETIKFEKNGLDVWDSLVSNGEKDVFPNADDMFRYKFFGFFHVKPAQDSFMLRGRTPGCVLQSYQLEGLAEIAQQWGGGYADLTTRGNVQIREIMPRNVAATYMKLTDLGIASKGSGADNLRNITASPTSGFDPQELIDVIPFAREMNHYISNNRDLFGLPRKFNISFDSGGKVSVCADTNDIAFYAVRVDSGKSVEPGIYFRVQLCGITGHKQFAKDCGILIKPTQAVSVAAAMVRVFIEHGNRTNRKKARLKYLIDDWGVEKFLEHTQQKLDFPVLPFPLQDCLPRALTNHHGHIGIYPQAQQGYYYIGVVVPVGRMSPQQMKGIASLAQQKGNGEIRLTAWQNLILPFIKKEDLDQVKQQIIDLGLHYSNTHISGGLIACTGNAGCKFAASNTKSHALELTKYLEQHIELDQPINIHLTGCHHSCAQHYIGDIGMIGAKIKVGDESVEGYSIVLGGGVEERQAIAHEVFPPLAFAEIKPTLLNVLKTYQSKRVNQETFWEFTRRHSLQQLQQLFQLTPTT